MECNCQMEIYSHYVWHRVEMKDNDLHTVKINYRYIFTLYEKRHALMGKQCKM